MRAPARLTVAGLPVVVAVQTDQPSVRDVVAGFGAGVAVTGAEIPMHVAVNWPSVGDPGAGGATSFGSLGRRTGSKPVPAVFTLTGISGTAL